MGNRTEKDMLGERQVPAEALWGIHALRAKENFPLGGYPVDEGLIKAYGYVKQACARANRDLGFLDSEKADAMMGACDELIAGQHTEAVIVDALAGGAGTSLNMNINEVIANRALQILGKSPGAYNLISPLGDVNRHQSTNDTFPTAVKVAALFALLDLEAGLNILHRVCQDKEKEFRDIVKIGRTETQVAVPITLGIEFSGYAESFAQDRWRVFKARERLRLVNLGGTAVGTGLGAPREYIFTVTDALKNLTGLNLCRAENLVYPTQSADSFCEVSGILKTCAVNLMKVARDLRLLATLGEIELPALQAGSSIMPGKVNPVVCEAVIQASLRCLADDGVINQAAGMGTLEINEFMPLIAFSLLEMLKLLTNSVRLLGEHMALISANAKVCREIVDNSPVIMTAFVPKLGYEKVLDLVRRYQSLPKEQKMTVREFLNGELGQEMVTDVLLPANLIRLGFDLDER